MLAPWECVPAAAAALLAGGVLCCYVATATQLSRTVEAIREQGGFDEPPPGNPWSAAGTWTGWRCGPSTGWSGHTGFLVTARRLARGVTAAAAAAAARPRLPGESLISENVSGRRHEVTAGPRIGRV